MYHVAIMKKSWGLIPKILSGEKTIESRWYKTKRTPWDKVKPGDTVYFKNSGEPVTAKAQVSKVLQFQIHQLSDIEHIISTYGKQICMTQRSEDLEQPTPLLYPYIPRSTETNHALECRQNGLRKCCRLAHRQKLRQKIVLLRALFANYKHVFMVHLFAQQKPALLRASGSIPNHSNNYLTTHSVEEMSHPTRSLPNVRFRKSVVASK